MSAQTDLSGKVIPEHTKEYPTKAGFITIFHNAMVYGNPLQALRYAERRERHRAFGGRFGPYRGMIIGEIPDPPLDSYWGCRILFQFYRPDPRVETRRASKRHLQRRGILLRHYNRYLKKNPLERYLEGKAPLPRHIYCSECGIPITRRRPGYKLKPVPLCQECNKK